MGTFRQDHFLEDQVNRLFRMSSNATRAIQPHGVGAVGDIYESAHELWSRPICRKSIPGSGHPRGKQHSDDPRERKFEKKVNEELLRVERAYGSSLAASRWRTP